MQFNTLATFPHRAQFIVSVAAIFGSTALASCATPEQSEQVDRALSPDVSRDQSASRGATGVDPLDQKTTSPQLTETSAESAGSETNGNFSQEETLVEQLQGPQGSSIGAMGQPVLGDFDRLEPLNCGEGGIAMQDSGPANNRVNIVIVGDGYQAHELDTTFAEHAQTTVDALFKSTMGDPYGRYRNFINVCRLPVVSNQSGIDNLDTGHSVDTALDGFSRGRLGQVVFSKVNQLLALRLQGTGTDPDWIFASLNTERWVGSGGRVSVYAGGLHVAGEMALHEGGHSFHGLADEYSVGGADRYPLGETWERNVTVDSGGTKWAEWLGVEQAGLGPIGSYEGAKYSRLGIYRPSEQSMMRKLGAPYNAPSRQAVIHDIYDNISPIDQHTDSSQPVSDEALGIKVIDPEVLTIRWFVNEKLAQTGGEVFDRRVLEGEHRVRVVVSAETDLVRSNKEALRQG